MGFYKIENKNLSLVFDNDAYTLETLDLGSADNDIATTSGIGEIGEMVSSSKLGGRNVNITGYILANSKEEMYKRKQYFYNIVSPVNSFVLFDKSGTKILNLQATATPKLSTTNYLNSDYLCMFSLDCFAANPCWTDYYSVTSNIVMWLPMFHFPLEIPKDEGVIVGLREPKLIATIENVGSLTTGIVIKFIAKGTLTNPALTNVDTGETIRIEKEMNAGDIVTINTNYGEKSIIDKDGNNMFKYLDLDNCSFLQLNAGTNNYKYSADTNEENLEVQIIYKQLYLGV